MWSQKRGVKKLTLIFHLEKRKGSNIRQNILIHESVLDAASAVRCVRSCMMRFDTIAQDAQDTPGPSDPSTNGILISV